MRFKFLSLFMLLCAFTFVRAEEDSSIIQSTDKAALDAGKGKSVTVMGKVTSAEWSKSGKVLNVEFDNDTAFVVAAFAKSREKLDAAFGGDIAATLNGAVVKLTGKLDKYGARSAKFQDSAQVIISMPSQVTIVTPSTQRATRPATDPAPAPATAPAGGM